MELYVRFAMDVVVGSVIKLHGTLIHLVSDCGKSKNTKKVRTEMNLYKSTLSRESEERNIPSQ